MASIERIRETLQSRSENDLKQIVGECLPDVRMNDHTIVQLASILVERCVEDRIRERAAMKLGLPTDAQEAAENAAHALKLANESLEVSRESADSSRAAVRWAKGSAFGAWAAVFATIIVPTVLTYCHASD